MIAIFIYLSTIFYNDLQKKVRNNRRTMTGFHFSILTTDTGYFIWFTPDKMYAYSVSYLKRVAHYGVFVVVVVVFW